MMQRYICYFEWFNLTKSFWKKNSVRKVADDIRSWSKVANFLSATLFLEGSALNFFLQNIRQMKAGQNKKKQ